MRGKGIHEGASARFFEGRSGRGRRLLCLVMLASLAVPAARADDPPCTVTILNQTANVDDGGNWFIFSVPANMGVIRARITCTVGGQTRVVMSDPAEIAANQFNLIQGLDGQTPSVTPVSIRVVPDLVQLGFGESTYQLRVDATYSDGAVRSVTSSSSGTRYLSSSSGTATISPDGLITAHQSGRILLTALHDSVVDTAIVEVQLTGDEDQDGMPDDFEVANGLDPSNPADAFEDVDQDLLINKDEYANGTLIRDADTDDDIIQDGAEVHGNPCPEAYTSDPRAADTDGDRLSDYQELLDCTDPRDAGDPGSLDGALASIELDPAGDIPLVLNAVFPAASTRQLKVTGRLRDNSTVDLTNDPDLAYQVDTNVAVVLPGGRLVPNLVQGAPSGESDVRAIYGSHTSPQPTRVTVTRFDPAALSALRLPGPIHGLALLDDYVLLAGDRAGMHVVDVSDPAAPVAVGRAWSPTLRARAVTVRGTTAYVAGLEEGVHVVDVSAPASPVLLETIPVTGTVSWVHATDDAIAVALGADGIALVDPVTHAVRSYLDLPGVAVRLDSKGTMLGVAAGSRGLHLVDVSNLDAPVLIGSVDTQLPAGSSTAADVVLRGQHAFVSHGLGNVDGLVAVNIVNPDSPYVEGRTTQPMSLQSLGLEGPIGLGADIFFINSSPIFDVTGIPPGILGSIDFTQTEIPDASGVDVALRGGIEYMAVNSGLQIARYAVLADPGGAPSVEIVSPEPGSEIGEGQRIVVRTRVQDDNYASVVVRLDGQEMGSAYAEPYDVQLTLPRSPGAKTLDAVATDLAGNTASSAPVAIDLTPDDDPTAFIAWPRTAVPRGITLPITVLATDDRTIAEVRVLVNGVLKGTRTAAPFVVEYEVGYNTTQLAIDAVVVDEIGQVATDRVVVPVNTDPPLPVVAITRPDPGTLFATGARVDVRAMAGAAIGIRRVRFFLDGATDPLATDTTEPYTTFFTTRATPGEHVIRAVAYDTQERTAEHEVRIPVSDVDPLTTVEGFVLRADGSLAVGATVRVLPPVAGSFVGLVGSDGRFSIEDVPTQPGDIVVSGRAIVGGTLQTGASEVTAPVPGGVTDLGTIHLVTQGPLGGMPYLPAPQYPSPGAQAFAAGDMDGDGLPELVDGGTDFVSPAFVRIRLGDGNGGVGPVLAEVSLGVTQFVDNVHLADLDGDTFLDVIVQCDGLRVLTGNGDGTLDPPVAYLEATGVRASDAADLDQDGDVDLVAAHGGEGQPGSISVLLGDGAGGFAAPVSVEAPAPITILGDLAVGEFDGDGRLDVVASGPSGHLALFLSGGSTPYALTASTVPTGQDSIADVNAGLVTADAFNDIVTISLYASGDGVVLLAGNGLGGFSVDSSYPVPGLFNADAELLDVDQDGRQDLVVFADGDVGETSIGVRLATRDVPALGDETLLQSRFLSDTYNFWSGDLNGDLVPDLFFPKDGVTAVFGDGEGSFHFPRRSSVPAMPAATRTSALGLLDAGAVPDLATAGMTAGAVQVLPGAGDGSFGSATSVSQLRPFSVRIGDLTEDGISDLVVAVQEDPGISLRSHIEIRPGNGSGGYLPPIASATVPLNQPLFAMELVDAEDDDDLDVLFTFADSGSFGDVRLWKNDDGTMQAALEPINDLIAAQLLATGDWDGNGFVDAVVASTFDGNVALLYGDADGFVRQPVSTRGDRLEFVALADVMGDEILDLVTGLEPVCNGGCTEVETTIVVYEGTALGFGEDFETTVEGFRLAPPGSGTDPGRDWVRVVDLDEDGRDDLVALSKANPLASVPSHLVWLRGGGSNGFHPPREFAGQGTTLAVGDVDGDGSLDLVTVDPSYLSVFGHVNGR